MMLTVDLDEPTRLDIVRAWFYLERHDPDGDGPEGRLSSGRKGVHLRSRTVYPHPRPVAAHHRRMAGDDPARIWVDQLSPDSTNQVLWTSKRGARSGEWTDSLDDLVRRYRNQFHVPPGVEHEAL